MKKVIGPGDECIWCGQNGYSDPLDRHHIFGGANRKNSEEDGLCVMLCHAKCHQEGPDSAHKSERTARRLKVIGQRYAMLKLGMTMEQFMERYGKNYLEESELDIWPEKEEIC